MCDDLDQLNAGFVLVVPCELESHVRCDCCRRKVQLFVDVPIPVAVNHGSQASQSRKLERQVYADVDEGTGRPLRNLGVPGGHLRSRSLAPCGVGCQVVVGGVSGVLAG
jgi:hypothetical protein